MTMYLEDRTHLRDAARKFTDEALETIVRIMRESDVERIKLDAASMLLDRAWGKPSQQIDLLRQDMQVVASLTRDELLTLAPKALAMLSGASVEKDDGE